MCKHVISISREFGSGGRLIGKKLAAKLDIPCYDRTIIQKTAEKSGLSPDFIARAEERARSRFHMSMLPVGMAGGSFTFAHSHVPVNHKAFFAQADVIRELADKGPCVIVGRCSDYILSDRTDCVKIFIHASFANRVKRCIKYYDIPENGIEARIRQMDRGRANYYNYYTGHTWGDMRRYDLSINSCATGIDGAVELIADMLRHREEHLKATGGEP